MISICSGCGVILIVSFIACVVPALQAASTDPSQVLRENELGYSVLLHSSFRGVWEAEPMAA